jgi:hypothetical protein
VVVRTDIGARPARERPDAGDDDVRVVRRQAGNGGGERGEDHCEVENEAMHETPLSL